MKSKLIRILIADDHKLIREGIKKLLELEDHYKIVGEAADGNEALNLARILKPDLLVLDLNMPSKTGLDVLEAVREEKLQSKVVLLTINDDKSSLVQALDLGADGYILKDSNPSNITEIIDGIMSGENYIDKRLVNMLVDIYKHNRETEKDKFSILTDREVEVLYYLSNGYTNAEISDELFIAEKTVKNYVTSIYSKLDLTNRVKAALFAIENDIEKYHKN